MTLFHDLIAPVVVGLIVLAVTSVFKRFHGLDWLTTWAIHLGRRLHPNKQIRELEKMCWYVHKNPWVIDSSFTD